MKVYQLRMVVVMLLAQPVAVFRAELWCLICVVNLGPQAAAQNPNLRCCWLHLWLLDCKV